MKELTVERIARVTGGRLHFTFLTEDAAEDFTPEYGGSPEDGNGGRKRPEAGTEEQRVIDALSKTEVTSIVTDSRRAGEGSLFGAIRGERVDGHSFIPKVYDQGALCVLSERPLGRTDLVSGSSVFWIEKGTEKEQKRSAGTVPGGLSGDGTLRRDSVRPEPVCRCWIEVPDSQEALRKTAEEYLKILRIPVVGITGSVGKTSTKEMIASVLGTHFRTLKTEGNFNNGLGLPLTVFRLRDEDQIAVLEMGVSHFGDMEQLARIARPSVMVITNIGTCHLEFLKDRDGILREKTDVFRFMKPSGRVILNGNDDKLRTIGEVNGQSPFWFGIDSETEGAQDLCVGTAPEYPGSLDMSRMVCAADVRPLGFEGTACTLRTPKGDLEVRVPVPGLHNVSNAAAAAAAGLVCGLSLEEIRRGIESAQTISGRFRILRGPDRTVIDDCYNANPVSMKSSLAVLAGAGNGRRVAVLGDMSELGEDEILLHEQVGAYAADRCDCLLAAGKLSKHLCRAALGKNPSLHTVWYPDKESLIAGLPEEIRPGDIVLVKASHFMGFSDVVKALTA